MNTTLLNTLTSIAFVAFVYYLVSGFPHLFTERVKRQWTDAALCLIVFVCLVQFQPERAKTCPPCGYDLNLKHVPQLPEK